MQKEAKEIIFDALRRLAIAKGADATKERLQICSEYLSKYELGKVIQALEQLFVEQPGFPDISKIIAMVDPKPDLDAEANNLANMVIESISSYGPDRIDDVKKHVGEKGWFVIERFGGWNNLCKIEDKEINITRAQLRDLCKSVSKIYVDKFEKQIPYDHSGVKKLSDHLKLLNLESA